MPVYRRYSGVALGTLQPFVEQSNRGHAFSLGHELSFIFAALFITAIYRGDTCSRSRVALVGQRLSAQCLYQRSNGVRVHTFPFSYLTRYIVHTSGFNLVLLLNGRRTKRDRETIAVRDMVDKLIAFGGTVGFLGCHFCNISSFVRCLKFVERWYLNFSKSCGRNRAMTDAWTRLRFKLK